MGSPGWVDKVHTAWWTGTSRVAVHVWGVAPRRAANQIEGQTAFNAQPTASFTSGPKALNGRAERQQTCQYPHFAPSVLCVGGWVVLCVCVRACVRACVRTRWCGCVRAWRGGVRYVCVCVCVCVCM